MRIIVAHFGTHYVGMPGGVEKLTCYLSSYLVTKGNKVAILYRDGNEGQPYFPIDSRVEQHNILYENGEKIISEKLPFLLRAYRECIRPFSQSLAQGINAKYKGKQYGPKIKKFLRDFEPDVILSCSAPSTKYVITDAGYKGPVVTMFRGDPVVQMPLLSKEEKEAVAKSAAIQVLWPSKIEFAHNFFPRVPVVAIGNAVFPTTKMANPGKKKDSYLISCVGNVSGRKNQKLLLEAFYPIASKYPDWNIEFWGEKSSRYAKAMEDEIKAKGLNDRVFVKGKTNHIEDVYARSDIFCIPSVSEGFPQGLAEAMSAGLPVIGLRTCGGTNELIDDGVNGFLVDNHAGALSSSLEVLMRSPRKRESMGNESYNKVKTYSPGKMWNMWDSLIKKLTGELN